MAWRPTKLPTLAPDLARIWRVGQLLLTAWVGVLIVLGVFWPDTYSDAWKLVLVQATGGRTFGVVWGLAADFPRIFILLHVPIQDIIILLLVYPLVIAAYRRVVAASTWLGSMLDKVHLAAQAHKKTVEPFGVAGVAAFVFLPIWSTGPIAGAVLGYLIGLRARTTFTAVIVGEVVNVAATIWLLDYMVSFAQDVSDHLPQILVAVLVAAIVWRAVRWGVAAAARRRTTAVEQARSGASKDE